MKKLDPNQVNELEQLYSRFWQNLGRTFNLVGAAIDYRTDDDPPQLSPVGEDIIRALIVSEFKVGWNFFDRANPIAIELGESLCAKPRDVEYGIVYADPEALRLKVFAVATVEDRDWIGPFETADRISHDVPDLVELRSTSKNSSSMISTTDKVSVRHPKTPVTRYQ